MTLDKEILNEARELRSRLVELQHDAVRAQLDYHHAIRRLHAGGGSMREIAEALDVSHQRVHQIVEQSKRTEQCWFCGRAGGDVGKMMAGPVALICDLCVAEAQVAEVGTCSFCSETKPVHQGAAADEDARICRSCLDFSAAVISAAASPR